jgi:hypothetical protein
MLKAIWFAAMALAWSGPSCAADANAAAAAFRQSYVEPTIVPVLGGWAGDDSAVTAPSVERIIDADAWTALWRRHSPLDQPPTIDFAKDMVIAIFTGTVSASLYGSHLEAVTDDLAHIDLMSGLFLSDVVRDETASLYLFVVLPRSTKSITVYRRVSGIMVPVSDCKTIGELAEIR